MAKSRKLQWSFAGGELSPQMFGHAEDPVFQIGAAKCQNFLITPHGPAARRPGFEYQVDAGVSTKASRLIPFVFSPTDTLIVEVAVGFFRFFTSSGVVLAYAQAPPAYIADQTVDFTAPASTTGIIDLGAGNNFYLGGERVQFGAGAPAPLALLTDYYVVYTLGDDIKVSTVPGGPPITGIAVASTIPIYRSYVRGDVVDVSTVDYYCTNPHISKTATDAAYWYALDTTGQLKIPHGFLETHIFELQFTQSADVLTITHPMYPPVELKRFGETDWTLQWVDFSAGIASPSGVSVVPSYGRVFDVESGAVSATFVYLYFQTPHELSEGDGVFIEGLNSFSAAVADGYYIATDTLVAIGGYPSGNAMRLKTVGTGEYVTAASGTPTNGTMRYTPISADSDNVYVVTAVGKTGVESDRSTEVTASDNVLYVEGALNTLTWLPVTGAKRYNVYKKQSGLFGYIGQVDDDEVSATYSFVDDNIAPDMGLTPGIFDDALSPTSDAVTVSTDVTSGTVTWNDHPLVETDPVWFTTLVGGAGLTEYTRYFVGSTITNNSFNLVDADGTGVPVSGAGTAGTVISSGDFPGAVAYFEQRRCFAGSRNIPQGLWMTRTGTESDMRYSLPVRDDDRVSVVISSRQASTVKHIVPMDHLLLMTTSAEYRLTPLNDDAITPTSISVRPQSYIGASNVRPMIANSTIVFCAARGGHVREMGFQAAAQGFVTGDLSLRAAHLFDDYTITDADQMKAPHSVLWFVSSSGKLLSLTYIPEESVGAWSWHDTNSGTDTFESVAVIPEGDEDRVWVCVKRGAVYTIEKMATQSFTSLTTGKFVDSWISETSATYALGDSFACAHIANARTVSVLVDGVVYPDQVVAAGAITMPVAVASGTVTVGLPYTSELQTMPFTAQLEAVAQGVRKNVNKVWLRVFESAPFQVGPDTANLSPSDPYAETTGSLTTDEIDITLTGEWTDDGQIVVRQSNPHPLTVVSATTLVTYGGD